MTHHRRPVFARVGLPPAPCIRVWRAVCSTGEDLREEGGQAGGYCRPQVPVQLADGQRGARERHQCGRGGGAAGLREVLPNALRATPLCTWFCRNDAGLYANKQGQARAHNDKHTRDPLCQISWSARRCEEIVRSYAEYVGVCAREVHHVTWDDINLVKELLPADPSQGYSAKDVIAYLLRGIGETVTETGGTRESCSAAKRGEG
eukprot:1176431-Prorocentrum_minimum.AAC.4